jgi:exopolysaccharide biosynthesis polyprenyl glycosylphosphotransferase
MGRGAAREAARRPPWGTEGTGVPAALLGRPEPSTAAAAPATPAVAATAADARVAPTVPAGPSVPLPPLVSARAWLAGLAALDLAVAALATVAGMRVRLSGLPVGRAYVVLGVALPVVWVAVLRLSGAYDRRLLAAGIEEYRRVTTAGTWLLAGVAAGSYATHADLSRGLVALTTPLVIGLTLAARLGARRALQRHLVRGRALHRVVVAGSREQVRELVRHMRRARRAGVRVVGACVPGGAESVDLPGGAVPVLGPVHTVAAAARRVGADTIAVTGGDGLPNGGLRQLSWQLEGTGIHLVVAPAITDIAGPRIAVRPVDGLPLLHVEEPQFTGGQRLLKEVADRLCATLLLLALSPLLLAIAAAVRAGDGGPVLFRQVRVGHHGREFVLWKFRTMRHGAEGERDALLHLNEHDGPLFKMRSDPRVTAVGGWLRRHSLDELPQLWNVVTGSMSLVGPRPPLPSEAARFPEDVQRRLLVKPGITGLWQVSGRADLSWEETVRLDLYYVENWSVTMDAALLWKTVATVLRGAGAY